MCIPLLKPRILDPEWGLKILNLKYDQIYNTKKYISLSINHVRIGNIHTNLSYSMPS